MLVSSFDIPLPIKLETKVTIRTKVHIDFIVKNRYSIEIFQLDSPKKNITSHIGDVKTILIERTITRKVVAVEPPKLDI